MPKITFLFWNTAGNAVTRQVENLVRQHEVSVLILAENRMTEENISSALPVGFLPVDTGSPRIEIFSQFHPNDFFPVFDSQRYTVKLLNVEGCEVILLVCLHFPSKRFMNNDQQNAEAVNLNLNLKKIEEAFGVKRTIVIGDFNMNPFDYGMVSHAGFNAVMTRKIAEEGSRKFQFQHYDYFYNPMWSFFGDLNDRISGTFYYRNEFHWHLFDQLLIRPSVIKHFIPESLEIITGDEERQFLNKNGRIDKSISDHLPLKFSLNL
jgi:hypothetical protein